MEREKGKKRIVINKLRTFAMTKRIVGLLAERPMTTAELSEHALTAKTNIKKYLVRLRALEPGEPCRVFIGGWNRQSSGRAAPIYKLGDSKDKPEPKSRTKAERWARHKERLIHDPEYLAVEMAKRKTEKLPKCVRQARRIYIDGKVVFDSGRKAA